MEGKETPRQKMIGMMYLVLTALLALNVSSTVLDKFAFINASLERANEETNRRNAKTLDGMKKAVEDKGSRAEDLKVIEDAESLRKKTEQNFAELEILKDTFIAITGGYEVGHETDRRFIVGKQNIDGVGHHMLPKSEGGTGEGEKLEELLNGYATFIKDILKKNGAKEQDLLTFEKLARNASEDPLYSEDENQKGKKFSQLAFENSPTHAGLATLSEFQASMLAYESAAQDFLVDRVGLKDITFDEIKPVVMPESRYVAAGTSYKAEMFIAASASALNDKISMSYNGRRIPVSNGIGKVEFTANSSTFDKEGNAKKTFKAAISVPLGGGSDTTFTSTIEYFVVKPVIQIQSQAVNALYYNCGNALDVQVPALGNQYNPSFSTKGGDAIKGTQRGLVTVVPKAKNVTLSVSSNGNLIGTRKFGVRSIPAPTIVITTDAGAVDLRGGIEANTPRLYIKAEADESFKQFLPNDARFRIAEVEVTLVSGGLARSTQRINGGTINLAGGGFASKRRGDQIVIEIRRVQRQNFRKQVENFPKFQRFMNISLK